MNAYNEIVYRFRPDVRFQPCATKHERATSNDGIVIIS